MLPIAYCLFDTYMVSISGSWETKDVTRHHMGINRMHPHVFICLHHTSVWSICLHMLLLRTKLPIFNTQFRENVNKTRDVESAKSELRQVASNRSESNSISQIRKKTGENTKTIFRRNTNFYKTCRFLLLLGNQRLSPNMGRRLVGLPPFLLALLKESTFPSDLHQNVFLQPTQKFHRCPVQFLVYRYISNFPQSSGQTSSVLWLPTHESVSNWPKRELIMS